MFNSDDESKSWEDKMARILIIDDARSVRYTLKKGMEKHGYEVVEAANGRAGLDLQGREPADLIVTEIFMPEMDGIEIIIELKRDYPDIPIIAISTPRRFGTVDYLRMSTILGADAVLSKPFEIEELIALVRCLLSAWTRESRQPT